VAPGGCHLQGSLRVLLAGDLGHVGEASLIGPQIRVSYGGPEAQLTLQVPQQAQEVGQAIYFQPVRQGSLFCVRLGNEEALVAVSPSHRGHGQHAVHVAQAAVEGELADEHGIGDVGQQLLRAHQQGHSDGQVVGGAFFAQVGRRQVQQYPAPGHAQTAVDQGGAHPLPRLLDGHVGKAHYVDAREPSGGGVYLYLNDLAL